MSTEPQTRRAILAAMRIAATLAEVIIERPIPEGELYAIGMTAGLGLRDFNAAIQLLVDSKVVRRSNHLLTWIGDERAAKNIKNLAAIFEK